MVPALLVPLPRPRPLSHVTTLARVLVVPTPAGLEDEVVTHQRARVHSGRMARCVRIQSGVDMALAALMTGIGTRIGTEMPGGGNGNGAIVIETGSGGETVGGGSSSLY